MANSWGSSWGTSWGNSWGTSNPNAMVGTTSFSITAMASASASGTLAGTSDFSFDLTGTATGEQTTTSKSGWWRLWLAQETQKQLDVRNAKLAEAEKKPEPVVAKKKDPIKVKPKKRVKIAEPEVFIRKPILVQPLQPSMYELIGIGPDFGEYSLSVYGEAARILGPNVIDLAARRKKKQRQEEEEFLLLLAA